MPILAYHSISDDWEHPLSVRPEAFRAQMEAIRARVVSLSTYLERFLDGSLANRDVAVTFDDAYLDNHVNAMPVLAEFGILATFFVPAGLIGSDADLQTGTARRLMDADALGRLARAGHSIGSHSTTHPDLRTLDDSRLEAEIAGSRNLLEERLAIRADFFCYPAGRFDERCLRLVREAGYAGAVVTPRERWGRQDKYRLRRMGIYRHEDTTRFRLKLTRAGSALRWVTLGSHST